MKGIIISTDGTAVDAEVVGLEQFQAVVNGDIEPVTLSDGTTMYVNEEGMLRPDCEINRLATVVAVMGGRSDLDAVGVHGDVLLAGPVDEEGDDTDVTAQARAWVETAQAVV